MEDRMVGISKNMSNMYHIYTLNPAPNAKLTGEGEVNCVKQSKYVIYSANLTK